LAIAIVLSIYSSLDITPIFIIFLPISILLGTYLLLPKSLQEVVQQTQIPREQTFLLDVHGPKLLYGRHTSFSLA
jgi:hypothetical protein